MSRSKRQIECPVCRRKFRPWSTKAIYCSNKCQQEEQYQRRLSLVKKTNDWSTGWNTSYKIRLALIRERGIKCQICGRTKWNGQNIPLVMDHIDGNSDNWKDDNLRLVCGNCDMQLPTYKSKNRGNGRHKRRQRYQDGKSY